MVRASATSHRSGLRPLRWIRRNRPLAIGLAFVAATGTAWAAANWTQADLPAFGGSGPDAFVLPETDLLPGGAERRRAPFLDEVPERPAIAFPEGVTYRAALRSYYLARQAGRVLPKGSRVVPPLPSGIAVRVAPDGHLELDPSAPLGFAVESKQVLWLDRAPRLGDAPPAIPRCQVLLQNSQPDAGTCGPGGTESVREGADGRWLPSPEKPVLGAPKGSDSLGILARARRPEDGLAAANVGPPAGLGIDSGSRGFLPTRSELQRSRLAREVQENSYHVVETSGGLCLVERGSGGGGMTCDSSRTLSDRGHISLVAGGDDDKRSWRIAGIVGDGFDSVAASEGAESDVVGNVYVLQVATIPDRLVFSGPAGEFTNSFGVSSYRSETSIQRRKRRALLNRRLSNGAVATWYEAPASGGESTTCRWLVLAGQGDGPVCGGHPDAERLDLIGVSLRSVDDGGSTALVLAGAVPSQVARLELDLQGETRSLLVTDGVVLTELPGGSLTADQPPVVRSIDRHGRAIQEQTLPLLGSFP